MFSFGFFAAQPTPEHAALIRLALMAVDNIEKRLDANSFNQESGPRILPLLRWMLHHGHRRLGFDAPQMQTTRCDNAPVAVRRAHGTRSTRNVMFPCYSQTRSTRDADTT